MENFKIYLGKVYDARYFWSHLAKIELKNKFRRSKLGILWTFVSPLCLTAIMSVVFSVVFKMEILTYAPYILSGLLFWDIFGSSFIAGSFAIISNESYIRQFNHPMTIYTLKSAIVYITNFLIALIALAIWIVVVSPANIFMGLVSLPLTIAIYFCFSWASTTIAAYSGTKYRDFPQMMPLILQFLWYLSPVFFMESMFKQNDLLYAWFNINPITHMIALLRDPFLYGRFPAAVNYLGSILFTAIICLVAVHVNKKNAKTIIFYI